MQTATPNTVEGLRNRVKWALVQDLEDGPKLVLVALAVSADDRGYVAPLADEEIAAMVGGC